MFSWITKSCSNRASCPFQFALNKCTYSDWSVPSEQDISYLIECFYGKHNDIIRSQKAFLKFKTKFQSHEDKNNAAFRLKNLLLLDRSTQQLCMLDVIAHYQYNRLFYDRNKVQPYLQNQSPQLFIGSYYLYIKKKAGIYQKLSIQLFNSKTRRTFIKEIPNLSRLFEFIDHSLQIQKLLNEANQNLKKVNKSPQLIQEILTCMLKTYIFAYSIVAICLQTLLNKVQWVKFADLPTLQKLLKFFSHEFSYSFLKFLESNKSINVFKNFQYSELIKVDPLYIRAFQDYLIIKNQQKRNPTVEATPDKNAGLNSPSTKALSIKADNVLEPYQVTQDYVQELPDDLFKKLTLQIKFSFQPRKNQALQKTDEDKQNLNNFNEYINYYSKDFIEDEQLAKQRQKIGGNSGFFFNLQASITSLTKISSKNQQYHCQVSRRQSPTKSQLQSQVFEPFVWKNWQNIYSSCSQVNAN